MMKKKQIIICSMLFFLSVINLVSQEAGEWYKELVSNFISEKSLHFLVEDMGEYDRVGTILEIRIEKTAYQPIKDLALTEYGFLRGVINNIIDRVKFGENKYELRYLSEPHFFVIGDEYLLVYSENPLSCLQTTMTDIADLELRKNPDFYKMKSKYYLDAHPLAPAFKKVSSSNSLKEKNGVVTFHYTGEFFSDLFLDTHMGVDYNVYALPWVEAVEGPGIGEWVQVDLVSPKKTFFILNGFVDPYRPHLYKMNSRVKDAHLIGKTASGKEITQDIMFADFAYFKTVVFTEPVLSMRLVIKSVYPGTKWQDTAISSIMLSSREKD